MAGKSVPAPAGFRWGTNLGAEFGDHRLGTDDPNRGELPIIVRMPFDPQLRMAVICDFIIFRMRAPLKSHLFKRILSLSIRCSWRFGLFPLQSTTALSKPFFPSEFRRMGEKSEALPNEPPTPKICNTPREHSYNTETSTERMATHSSIEGSVSRPSLVIDTPPDGGARAWMVGR